MLYSIVLNLRSLSDAVVRATLGYHAYSLFMAILRSVDQSLATRLHDDEGLKPFTLSGLQGKFQRKGGKAYIPEGAACWLRLTFLTDDLFSQFMHAVLNWPPEAAVRLDTAEFVLEDAVTSAAGPMWSGCRSYEDLLAAAAPHTTISLRFLSPTTFRSRGNRNVIFPAPSLVFGSYLARWNSFAPYKLPDRLAKVFDERLSLAGYSLRSRMLDFQRYQEVGFEGVCHFKVSGTLAEDDLLALDVLGQFAFFCGTGAKTTMGMGQTRRVDDAGPLSYRARLNPA